MIFQSISIAGYEWIIGLGLSFSLAFLVNYFIGKRFSTFFVFLLMFTGFSVLGGLLETWVLILMMIVSTVIVFLHSKTKEG